MHGRLYKRKDGNVWLCWFYDKAGKQHCKSTKCTDRRSAEAVLRRFEQQENSPADLPQNEATTVYEALDKLIDFGCSDLSPATTSMYVQKSRHLIRLVGEDFVPLNPDRVLEYINTRKNEGAHLETIRKELVTLRRALQMVKAPIDCIPKFKVRYTPRETFLTLDEFQKLLAVLKPHRQLWVVLAVYTGGRDSEIDGLRWEHVDWTAKTVLLPGTKTKKSRRRVPLTPLLEGVLEKCREKSGLIVGDWSNIRRDLHDACTASGLDKKISPNDLRRTYASWMKQAGVDSFVVAQLLGHSTSRMVELVYGRLDPKTLSAATATLPGGDCSKYAVAKSALLNSLLKSDSAKISEAVETTQNQVLGAGIEPATRGFSVRKESKVKYCLHLLKSA